MDLLINNIIIQLFVLLVQYTLGTYFNYYVEKFYSGILALWFYYLTIFCIFNEKQIKLCCFHIKINRKYYFLIIFMIATIWNFSIQIDITVAMLIGLLKSTVLKNNKSILQSKHYESLENLCHKINLHKFNNWIVFKSNN